MAVRTYTSITVLNLNGLNVPVKRNRIAKWKKNKNCLHAVYKRLTSNIKTLTERK